MTEPVLIRPVILSGGSGTRLWPLSRQSAPKQFQPLTSPHSLFHETLDRVSDRRRFEAPLIVCNQAHEQLVERELAQAGIGDARLILEPCGRNTAPAIVTTCLLEAEDDPDRPLLFLPSDHWTARPEVLAEAAVEAVPLARRGGLVLFGIQPDRIETGYGYIELGPAVGACVHQVDAFVEKPPREAAAAMIADGRHVWNSGIFLFTAKALLGEAERLRPGIVDACRRALATAARNDQVIALDAGQFATAEALSIDHGILEHTKEAFVIPIDPGWSDVGSWPALHDLLPKDADGNAVEGPAVVRQTSRSLVRAARRTIAVVGVEDLVIVDTDDALLVAHKDAGQEIRGIVESLRSAGAAEAERHPEPFPPGFDVRVVVVPPGPAVELTLDAATAGHVLVLDGTVELDVGLERRSGRTGDSLRLPAGRVEARSGSMQPATLALVRIPLPAYEVKPAPAAPEAIVLPPKVAKRLP